MNRLFFALAASFILLISCKEEFPNPDKGRQLSLLAYEYPSGIMDSIQFNYDKRGRLQTITFLHYEGTDVGHSFKYDNDGKLISQRHTDIFFGAATFVITERDFEYEHHANGIVAKEFLTKLKGRSALYGDKPEVVTDTIYDPPLPATDFIYNSQLRLTELRHHIWQGLWPEQFIFNYDLEGQLTKVETFDAKRYFPDQLEARSSFEGFEFDSADNPLQLLSDQLGMPLPIYFDIRHQLDMPLLISPNNITEYSHLRIGNPLGPVFRFFQPDYGDRNLPETISMPFISQSHPIRYRFVYRE